ncbi:hypothetical protein F3J44_19915 [Pantoea sp. Tr-811]|uniref:hypothetical protein n=1 Tax=Pantoea sp. Tr-811 TaxID=2608361 RepID=UPI001422FF16|nr:hypothetical protein [Pantoea sp. Tr-811]NIF28635.1 hypothetical protein [Pantoea sp. Tr-811]
MATFKAIEFTDVKPNDFIELAGIEAHRQSAVVAEHRAKWRLRQLLEANQVQHPYDQIYFTGHPVDGVIDYSKSLVEIMTQAVLDNERASTQFGTGGGFYSAAYTTSREANLDLDADLVSAVMGFVYDHIKDTETKG